MSKNIQKSLKTQKKNNPTYGGQNKHKAHDQDKNQYPESGGRFEGIEEQKKPHFQQQKDDKPKSPEQHHQKGKSKHHQKKPATVPIPQKRLNDAKNLEMLIGVYQIIDEELTTQQGIWKELNRVRSTTQMSEILINCRSLIREQISASQTLMKNCQGIVDSVSGIIPEENLISNYADIIRKISSEVSNQLEWKVALGSCLQHPDLLLPKTHLQRVELFAKTLQEISDRAILFAENDIAWNRDSEMVQMLARFKSKL